LRNFKLLALNLRLRIAHCILHCIAVVSGDKPTPAPAAGCVCAAARALLCCAWLRAAGLCLAQTQRCWAVLIPLASSAGCAANWLTRIRYKRVTILT
jgi:hypothetical protein